MKELKPLTKISVISVIGIIFIIIIASYTNDLRKTLDENSSYSVRQNTYRLAKEIDLYIKSSFDNIKLTSYIVSQIMTDRNLQDPSEILKDFIQKSPFSYIEYMTDSGIPYEGREFYYDGMNGNSGIWVNYDSYNSSGCLVNFYTPLYLKGETVGVLTGVVSAKSIIEPLMEFLYRDEETVGLLCDKNGRVITATFDFVDKLFIKDLMNVHGVSLEGKEKFLNRNPSMDDSVFRFYANDGIGFGCMQYIKSTGWSIVQILPSHIYKKIFYNSLYMQFFMIGMIVILFLLVAFYIAFTSYRNNKLIVRLNKRLSKEKSEEKERYYTIVQESLVKAEKYKSSVLADAITIFEVNLTQNIMDYGKVRLSDNKTISLEEVLNEKFPCTYDLYIEKWAEKYVKSTAKMDFLANTNRVYL
nr:hypothetical protein [Treponema sp.]